MTTEHDFKKALNLAVRGLEDAIYTMRKRAILPYEELMKEMEYRQASLEHIVELIERNILDKE